MEFLIPIVAILSTMIGLPALIFAYILGNRFLQIQERRVELLEREVSVREEEAELERQHLEFKLRLLEDEQNGGI